MILTEVMLITVYMMPHNCFIGFDIVLNLLNPDLKLLDAVLTLLNQVLNLLDPVLNFWIQF